MYCTNDNFIKNKSLYFCIGGKNIVVNLDPLCLCHDRTLSDCNHTKRGAAVSTLVPVCERGSQKLHPGKPNPLKILLN